MFISGDAAHWRSIYKLNNINFIALEEETLAAEDPVEAPKFMTRSYRVYQWVLAHQARYDVVVYHDYMVGHQAPAEG